MCAGPADAFEVEGVFEPVTGVDEGEVDEDEAVVGCADGVAAVEIAVAPGVDLSCVPAADERGEGAADFAEFVCPFGGVGDDASAGDLAGFFDELVEGEGLGGWAGRGGGCVDRLDEFAAGLHVSAGAEEVVEGGAVEVFADG